MLILGEGQKVGSEVGFSIFEAKFLSEIVAMKLNDPYARSKQFSYLFGSFTFLYKTGNFNFFGSKV